MAEKLDDPKFMSILLEAAKDLGGDEITTEGCLLSAIDTLAAIGHGHPLYLLGEEELVVPEQRARAMQVIALLTRDLDEKKTIGWLKKLAEEYES